MLIEIQVGTYNERNREEKIFNFDSSLLHLK